MNERARPFVERWLGGEPKNKDDRKQRTQLVNRLTENGIPDWHEQTRLFLFRESGPYQRWTYALVKKDQGIERPLEEPEPRQPEENAPKEKWDEFQRRKERWKDNEQKLKRWNVKYSETFYSSENVLAFLCQPPDHQDLDVSACRAAAVVVLELAAKHIAEKAKKAMETAPLGSLFSVSLALPWVFQDGTRKSVDRLTIRPAPEEKTTKSPESLPQSPNNAPPSAATPSKQQ